MDSRDLFSECLVTLDSARVLKLLGFKEPCFHAWSDDTKSIFSGSMSSNKTVELDDIIINQKDLGELDVLIPTLSQAQRFLFSIGQNAMVMQLYKLGKFIGYANGKSVKSSESSNYDTTLRITINELLKTLK